MLRNTLRSWKRRPIQFGIIVIGYVISILVVSVLISGIQKRAFEYNQSNFGKLENRTAIYIHTEDDGLYKNNTINILKELGKSAEVDVLKLDIEEFMKDKKVSQGQVVPFYYEKKTDWQPALYSGRFITPEECKGNSKRVILGRAIAEELKVNIGDSIDFYNDKYVVTGIIGKRYMDTNFDRVAYIPVGSLPQGYISNFDGKTIARNGDKSQLSINVLFRANENRIKDIFGDLSRKFNNNFRYDVQTDVNLTVPFSQVFTDVVVVSLPLLIVALINIINISIFWIDGRKKEISIKKVLGANDAYIKRSVEKDMLLVAVISSTLALLVQILLLNFAEPIVNKYEFTFNLSWINFIVGLGLALFIGYFASLIPVEKTLDMNPADAIKAI
ncbi:ABC transporter permease [Clostridium folliculivorans]|uniref:ABC transporter permease n=1 Tax=Clostridium folliculivorans TaxID=2886038 RepID=A0A9W5Y2J0_9CLOT|nr:ABC transporter permease [Clostridium folliculivorans]GKU25421.1 hypothetical protein CFOLD11_22470 [Clostridium folliculivorans]GKU28443.1 hypothetical protein CFB3_05490 [Clostridium folliculivorans]